MEPEPAEEHVVVESEVSLIDRVENVSARILDDCDTNQIETEIKKKNVKDKKMRRENVSVNEMDKEKNTCEYCNKKFKNLGAIPKHEEKCKKRK